jgi:AcrR family transcriptional regulator
MARVRRHPDERRAELIEAAARLFAERGVDETAVSDIVAACHVSQGTFYWYFPSKDDVANAVVERLSEQAVAGVLAIAEEPGPAVDRLLRMRDGLLSAVDADAGLLAFFHRAGNEAFHDRVSRDAVRRIVPAVRRVIEDGVAEGVFRIRHTEDAARFIAALMDVTDPFDTSLNPERMGHHAEGLTEFALRGLGCDEAALEAALGHLPPSEAGGASA